MGLAGFRPNSRRGVVFDGLAGLGIVAARNLAEPHFGVVCQFGHSPDGGAGGFDGVGLLDCDGRPNILDLVDGRFVE